MKRTLLLALLFTASFGLFLSRTYPSIAPLDSAELSAVGGTLGIAHSPGYPLFSLAGKAWSVLLPLGTPAFRMNLFSAVCSAAALVLLAAGASVSGWAAALCAALTLLQAPAFLKEAVSTEVFALNTALAAALVTLMGLGGPRRLLLAAFLFGLALGNQHTFLLALPALLLMIGRDQTPVAGSRLRGMGALLLRGLPLALLGLSVYLFLWLRSQQGPVMNWEQPDTLARFWGLVTRARYGTLALAQGGDVTPYSFDRASDSLYLYFLLFTENLGWVRLLLVLGLVRLFLYAPWFAGATVLGWLFTGPVFFVMTKMGFGEQSRMIMERFLPLSLVFVAPWAGAAGSWLAERWRPVLLGVFLLHLPAGLPDGRWSLTHPDLIRNHFRTLPPGSVLVADRADEVEFGTAYMRAAEGRRPDLTFIDGNAGVTPSIYGPDYYRIWGLPRLKRRQQVEKDLIARSEVPVYYATQEPGQLEIAKERDGLLWRAKGGPSGVPWDELYALRWSPDMPRRERYLAWSQFRLTAEDALELGDTEGALAGFRSAAAASDDPGLELHYAGVSFYERGFFAEAVALLERALVLHPSPLAWSNIGAARERLGDMPGALAAYRTAVQLGPDLPQAHFNLGAACWKTEEWECSAASFARAVNLDPANASAKVFAERARQKIKR